VASNGALTVTLEDPVHLKYPPTEVSAGKDRLETFVRYKSSLAPTVTRFVTVNEVKSEQLANESAPERLVNVERFAEASVVQPSKIKLAIAGNVTRSRTVRADEAQVMPVISGQLWQWISVVLTGSVYAPTGPVTGYVTPPAM